MKLVLSKRFFESRDTPAIANVLLGKFLVRRYVLKETNQHNQRHHVDLSYMITEVEAYDGPRDRASHAHRGKTTRNFPMFGSAGNWYVYFTYGMHWLLNIVTGPKNYPAAVLIRGAGGIIGPARLTRALSIDKTVNALPSGKKTGLWIEDRCITIAKSAIRTSPRMGVDYAGEWSKRFLRYYTESPAVSWNDASTILASGGIGIVPTDTIYGLVGSALDPRIVERIYRVRRRGLKKPMIILIGSMRDFSLFGVALSPKMKKVLRAVWPGKVSVILPCRQEKFSYLHRGTHSLAFRMPRDKKVRALLRKAGPLIAPSANIAGKPMATTTAEAKKYFKNSVDFCVDGGRIKSPPSTLISIERDGSIVVKRHGAVKLR